VFVGVELVALPLWLALGRHGWFAQDEWDFLAARKAGDLGDLFRGHNVHWVTVPVLVYRLLYWTFGLRSYFPYRCVIVIVHLAAAALLLVVMRRAGVNPWIATAAGTLFVLLGSGWQNIVQPFQICFTGALAFGLAHLLLADHDGPSSRRDAFGLVAGLLGLMCSGVGVTMVGVVGLAVLLRRGWRPALLHTVPLAACYLVWLGAIGHDGYGDTSPTLHGAFGFVWNGVRAAYQSMGQIPGLGVILAILLVVGLLFAWNERRGSGRRAELAAPVALLIGSIVFLTITATGRLILGAGTASSSRYVYIVAAMTLPALAVAADALTARWRWFLPVAIVLFLVGIPANIDALRGAQRAQRLTAQTTRRIMLTLPRDPIASRVPRSLVPDPLTARQVTIGWLLDGVAQHRIPAPARIVRRDRAANNFRLSFDQRRQASPTTSCFTLRRATTVALEQGDVIGLSGNVIRALPASGPPFVGPPLQFSPTGDPIAIVNSPGPVSLSPFFYPARICIGRPSG
jgi:hypothetical protein